MSKERAQKCQIALFEEACALVTPIHKDDTPAECATIIHDRIITRKYNYAGEGSRAHSIDGALINNQAVCIGWSEAFKLCLDLAKIPCATVSCECIENGKHAGAHALNIVDLSDGHTPHWNVVDITFDGSKTGANRHPSHTYFGLSASQTQGRYEFLSWGFTPKLADSYSVYG